MDSKMTVAELKEIANTFRTVRKWKKFHNPKDLALALSIEVSELLEHFRFLTQSQMKQLLKDPVKKKKIASELADIQYLVSILSIEMDIDLSHASQQKFGPGGEADQKYPIELCMGKNMKHHEYQKNAK